MFKQILVPLDGSEFAEKALDYARKVVAPDGTIHLLTVVLDFPELITYDSSPILHFQSTIDESRKRAMSYLEKIKATLPGDLKVELIAEVGEPPEVITETAEKINADVIVISTHGRTGVGRWLLGSVTNKVITSSGCPILVIPSKNNA